MRVDPPLAGHGALGPRFGPHCGADSGVKCGDVLGGGLVVEVVEVVVFSLVELTRKQ